MRATEKGSQGVVVCNARDEFLSLLSCSVISHRLCAPSCGFLPTCVFLSPITIPDSGAWVITISNRRFLIRPLSVSFVVIGLLSP